MGETWETSAECRNHTDLFHSPYIDYTPQDHTFLGLPGTTAEALAKQKQIRADAKKVCASCDVAVDCAIWALQNQFFGVAAGMTPDEAAVLREVNTIKVEQITSAQMAEYAGVAEGHGGRRILQAAQVLPLVEAGWTNKQIADHFDVSVRTVIRVRVDEREEIEVDEDEVADPTVWADEMTIEDVAFDIVDGMRAAARKAQQAAALGPILSAPDPLTLGEDTTAPSFTPAAIVSANAGCPATGRRANTPLLPGKAIHARRLSDFMICVWTMLADEQWHHLDEVFAVASPHITDEEAVTAYGSSRRCDAPMSADIIEAGKRLKIMNAISISVRTRGTIEQDGDWYRATSNALASVRKVHMSNG